MSAGEPARERRRLGRQALRLFDVLAPRVAGERAAPGDVQVPGKPGDPAEHLERPDVQVWPLGPPRGHEPVDLIAVGFPCQDISYSGKGAGIKKGARSGIWKNIVEGIRTVQPKIVVVENVAALRRRGLDRVLGDLASLGDDAVWTSLRAGDVGAPGGELGAAKPTPVRGCARGSARLSSSWRP